TLSINSHSFSTFLSAFFDFPFFSPFFNIFPLHSLFLFILSHSCSLFYLFFFQLFCPSIPTLFSTFLSAFFDFPFFSLLHSILSPFNIFPLHSLFISLSIATPVHSSFLSSFTLLSFLLPFLTFAFHALLFLSGNA